jgi:hypothetical protein
MFWNCSRSRRWKVTGRPVAPRHVADSSASRSLCRASKSTGLTM